MDSKWRMYVKLSISLQECIAEVSGAVLPVMLAVYTSLPSSIAVAIGPGIK